MKNNYVFNIIQIIFSLAGVGMIIGGYFASAGAKTDDGFPLNNFLYILGGFFIVWPILLFGVIKYFIRRAAEKVQYLKDNGIRGKARVPGMRRTGVTINNVPQMILNLDIKTNLGEHYTTDYKKTIEPMYFSIIRPDTDLPVLIDPADKKKVYVDFEEAWKAMSGIKN